MRACQSLKKDKIRTHPEREGKKKKKCVKEKEKTKTQ